MPIYQFLCPCCGVLDKYLPLGQRISHCELCAGPVSPLISAPQGIRVPNMAVLTAKRQRVREPRWKMPDGSYQPINSATTRTEES